jgi:two-component system KDP operon response regulator KdpE
MTGSKETKTILVIEDSQLHQRLVRDVLQHSGYKVLAAESAERAMEKFGAEHPDLVIVDLGLPGMNGLDFLAELREISEVPVIILTSSDSLDDKLRGFELGADDYLTKPFNSQILVARIHAVLRRADLAVVNGMGVSKFQSGPLNVDFGSHKVEAGGNLIRLTATEFALLKEFIRYQGRILTHGQLLTAVWGPEYQGERELLRTNIYRLRKKLEIGTGGIDFIQSQVGVGYWFEPVDSL